MLFRSQQGSPYLADLMLLNTWIDGDVNPKIICLMASYLQKKNMQAMGEQQAASIQATAQAQKESAAQAAQLELMKEQQLSAIRMAENDHITQNQMKLLQLQSQLKTENQLIANQNKSEHKINEKVVEKTLGA